MSLGYKSSHSSPRTPIFMSLPTIACTTLLALLCTACASSGGGKGSTDLRAFGTTTEGRPARLWVLESPSGMVASFTEFGATLVSLEVPDADGKLADVVLGFDDVRGYQSDGNQYFGCTVGRVANRVRSGAFELDGRLYQLARNDGDRHHLHGGSVGWGQKLWTGRPVTHPEGQALEFRLTSGDGDEGYPGKVEAKVTYVLTRDGELRIDYLATADSRTPLNMTHHSYFNLGGHGSGGIHDHELRLAASRYTAVDDGLIPTGELAPVDGTPVDFRESTAIGARLDALVDGPTIGYDHNFVLDSGGSSEPVLAAEVVDPASGRRMQVLTTEPGLQFYSGNFLKGQQGKGGRTYAQRSAFCLEAQHFPDSVNVPSFPSIILEPGEEYRKTTIYRFDAR